MLKINIPFHILETTLVIQAIATQTTYPFNKFLNKFYEKTTFRFGTSSYNAGYRMQSKE